MRTIIDHMTRYDWLLMGAVLLLMAFGIISLFSLSGVSAFPFFERQLVWAGTGLAALIAASFIDFRLFRTQSYVVFLLYCATVVLLLATLASNFAVRGVTAWLSFGNVLFQPVEPAKIALVILFAKFFSKRHIEIYRLQHLAVSGFYLAVPTALVLLQPDVGSAMVLVILWVAIIVFSGMRVRHFIMLLALAAALAAVAWFFFLEPYQQARITAFLNPYADSQGAGYQMIQSMIAVGSGRIWGKGLGYGSQTHLHFLPEAETDFIFAAFAEEWGFAGSAMMIGLFTVVLWRIIRIGQLSADNFSRLYAVGFAALVFSQAFIHIGMNVGVLPITGLTLPFVSYGGSSLVTLLVGVGILQNIKINSRREIE